MNKFTIKTGDVLEGRVKAFPLIFHYGIVTVEPEETYIHHNTPTQKNRVGGSVIKEPLANFLKTRTITNILSTSLSVEAINEISHSMADRKFNLINFNCEHFISIFTNTASRSPQMLYWTLAAVCYYAATRI